MKSFFVDLQVNGFLNVDFSGYSLTRDGILLVADHLEKNGTGMFLPTVITSSPEVYRHVLPLLADVLESEDSRGRLPGIHLEGPFISCEDGAVGAHPKQYVATPSIKFFDELFELSNSNIKLLTVAPEREGIEELIRHAVKKGVTVSIGHCLADDEAVIRAINAGATLSTHLGNGVPNLINRHRNPIYAQFASPLTQMLISDGHHLPVSFLKIAFALKGVKKTIITSDSAPVAGMPPGEYDIFGTRVQVCEDGAIRNLNAPTLAGSSALMIDCMNFLLTVFPGLSEADLWTLGRDNPLAAIGLTGMGENLSGNVELTESGFKVQS